MNFSSPKYAVRHGNPRFRVVCLATAGPSSSAWLDRNDDVHDLWRVLVDVCRGVAVNGFRGELVRIGVEWVAEEVLSSPVGLLLIDFDLSHSNDVVGTRSWWCSQGRRKEDGGWLQLFTAMAMSSNMGNDHRLHWWWQSWGFGWQRSEEDEGCNVVLRGGEGDEGAGSS